MESRRCVLIVDDDEGIRQTLAEILRYENYQVVHAHCGEEALERRVRERTSGEGVELVFNTVGSSESIAQGLRLVRKSGKLVLLATKEEEIYFPSLGLSGERSIRTSSNAMASDFPRVIDMISSRKVLVEPLITHRFPLGEGLQAFAVALDKRNSGAIKVIIEVGEQ